MQNTCTLTFGIRSLQLYLFPFLLFSLLHFSEDSVPEWRSSQILVLFWVTAFSSVSTLVTTCPAIVKKFHAVMQSMTP
jgi:hypothetical protein